MGVISDRKGRKPVVLVCIVLCAIGSLMFGLSVNLTMAIVARFIMGFFNGKDS